MNTKLIFQCIILAFSILIVIGFAVFMKMRTGKPIGTTLRENKTLQFYSLRLALFMLLTLFVLAVYINKR